MLGASLQGTEYEFALLVNKSCHIGKQECPHVQLVHSDFMLGPKCLIRFDHLAVPFSFIHDRIATIYTSICYWYCHMCLYSATVEPVLVATCVGWSPGI